MPGSDDKALAFKIEVQRKIQSLLREYALGKLSQGQFDVIYDRYHNQLLLAEFAVEHASDETVEIAQSGPPTISIKQALKGKAVGLSIYHITSGALVETLGRFDVAAERIIPTFTDMSEVVEGGDPIGGRVEQITDHRWLLFTGGRFTIVVTLFHNEPSLMQCQVLERLHRDFETANHLFLAGQQVDPTRPLAFPFQVFIQRRLSG